MRLFRRRNEKRAQALAEFRAGVSHGIYKPYICDGEKWVPLDVDKAEAMLRAREKVIRELLKHMEEEQDG